MYTHVKKNPVTIGTVGTYCCSQCLSKHFDIGTFFLTNFAVHISYFISCFLILYGSGGSSNSSSSSSNCFVVVISVCNHEVRHPRCVL